MSDFETRESCLKEAIAMLTHLVARMPDVRSKTDIMAARRKIVSAMRYRDIMVPTYISEEEKVHKYYGQKVKTAYHEADGTKKHISEWCEIIELSLTTVRNYLSEGMTMQEILDAKRKNGRVKAQGHKPAANHEWIKQASIKAAQADQKKKDAK